MSDVKIIQALYDALDVIRDAETCCDLSQRYCGKAESAKKWILKYESFVEELECETDDQGLSEEG